MRRLAALVLAVGLASGLAACGGDDDDAADADDADSTTTTAEARAADEPAVPGLALLETEPVDGSELRPLLSWSAVDGATRYSLLVFADDGAAYWAWEGTDTQVHLGGGVDEPLPDEAEGPTSEHASSWFVVAHSPDGTPIASSPELEF